MCQSSGGSWKASKAVVGLILNNEGSKGYKYDPNLAKHGVSESRFKTLCENEATQTPLKEATEEEKVEDIVFSKYNIYGVDNPHYRVLKDLALCELDIDLLKKQKLSITHKIHKEEIKVTSSDCRALINQLESIEKALTTKTVQRKSLQDEL